MLLLQADPTGGAAPWLVVILVGAVAGLFGALMTFVLRYSARDTQLINTCITEIKPALSANTDAIRSSTAAIIAQWEQSKEQRQAAQETDRAILARLESIDRTVSRGRGEGS